MPQDHSILPQDQWIAARKALLAKEKEFTRLRDELSSARRALPWTKVTKDYVFDGPEGKESLNDLFDGRSQLIIYHFMFHPDWSEGCKSCSFWADNFNNIIVHLNHRDVSMVAISRAPREKLADYQKRMGWTFKWLSSAGNSFNFDFGVSFTPEQLAAKSGVYNYKRDNFRGEEAPGISVFARNEKGEVFHTYSTYGRGLDMLNGAYHLLDLVPKGRDEDALEFSQSWVRRHDQYGA
jgi:predicted dithiol-disulfide oxidoreductase (DUF899 family)